MLLLLLVAVYVVSLTPSLSVPYIIDDLDHLHTLARSLDSHRLTEWLFTPHNEHVMPLLKLLYLACYQAFGLNPIPFHVVVIAVAAGNLVVLHNLVRMQSGSKTAALIAAACLAATNLPDDALFVGTNSHIFFCVFFLMLCVLAVHRFAIGGGPRWGWLAAAALAAAPATFALGLLALVLVPLYVALCVPAEARARARQLGLPLLGVFALSCLPYLFGAASILYAQHYQDVGSRSMWEAARFREPVRFLAHYVLRLLVPGFVVPTWLSIALFVAWTVLLAAGGRRSPWGKVTFWAIFGLLPTFFIFTLRMRFGEAWGLAYLDTPRYYAFPVVFLAAFGGLGCAARSRWGAAARVWVALLCSFLVVQAAGYRFVNARLLAEETALLGGYYRDLLAAFNDYPGREPLAVRDAMISFPPVQRLAFKYSTPPAVARYPARSRSFMASFILPARVRERLVWGQATDPRVVDWLEQRKLDYLVR